MLFQCQNIFDQSCDNGKFTSWVESLSIAQNNPQGLECVRCDRCKKIPTNVYYNHSEHAFPFAMRFSCFHCRTYWNVCKCCSVENQPNSFVTYSLRQQINGRRLKLNDIVSMLDESIVSHSSYHDHSNAVDNHTNDVGSEIMDSADASTNNVEAMVQDVISNMFERNVTLSPFECNLKQAILERETKKLYPDYLIKKYWLKNFDCNLLPNDVIMFFRHIRYIMQQSRDDNNELCSIIASYDKRNMDKYNSIYAQLQIERSKNSSAEETIATLKSLLQSYGVVYEFPTHESSHLTSDSSNVSRNDDASVIRLKLPSSKNEIRQLLESNHSLIGNILVPPITFHDGGMSWVKPSDALRQAICLGVPFDVVIGRNYSKDSLHERSIYRSQTIYKLISESDIDDDVVTVVFGFWSDGCYCGTESKGRRNQAKISTIHISHHQVTERHVFPIMFGRKDDNDDYVKKQVIEDMINLSKTTVLCYIPSIREVKKVRFLLAYAILDRIEHAEITCFMGPTGKCSRPIMLSCPISTSRGDINTAYSLCKSLKSCWSCWNKRVESLRRGQYQDAYRSRRCRECYDWNLKSVEFFVPPNFPIDTIPEIEKSTFHPNSIKSKIITFETMKDACQTIFDKVKDGTWNQSIAGLYAKRECIRESIWKDVWKSAKDVRSQGEVEIQQATLDQSTLPSFWTQDLLSLEGFHLGIMHYLFLNVGKHLMEIMNMKMSELGIWSNVYETWSNILITVRKLCLSWCKGWTLGSSTLPASMWVSENFVGFSIICKSMASILYTINRAFDHVPYVQELLDSYYTLCAIIMSPDPPTERHYRYASALAKCFCSIVDDYCSRIERQRINKIESTSCFVNLLNVGERMKDYGIMRNYWEGGFRGEGIFRPMKQLITRGLHCNKISLQTMTKQYKRLAIDDLIRMKEQEDSYVSLLDYELSDSANDNSLDEDISSNDDGRRLDEDPNRYRRFYCYNSPDEFREMIYTQSVASVTQHLPSNQLYAFIGRRRKEKKMCKIDIMNWENIRGTNVCDVSVHNVLHAVDEISPRDKDYMSCLLLPLYHVVGNREEHTVQMKYFIVREDHKEMTSERSFQMPSITLEEKDDPSRTRNNVENAEMIRTATEICTDRSKCLEFIGQRVQPIGDLPFGIVTHFKHLRSITTIENSLWTVKYYMNQECEGNARKQEGIGYYELMNRLIPS